MAEPPFDVDPPLSLEPVEGWRSWSLDRVDGALALRSVTRADHWPARDAMVATCFAHRAWTVPDENCTCGLYAAASPEQLVQAGVFGEGICVVGTVAMWGRLIEYTLGARSRFAYPSRLRLVCGRCLALGAGAVTPVMVLGGAGGSLKAVCRAHWTGPSARAVPASDIEAELLSTYGVELLPIELLSGGLRIRPVRITRRAVPVDKALEPSRFGWRVAVGMFFAVRVVGILLQSSFDASAAQPNVTPSPPAFVSSSVSTTGSDVRVAAETAPPGTSWPRWLGPSAQASSLVSTPLIP
jgi:hypothetical protein